MKKSFFERTLKTNQFSPQESVKGVLSRSFSEEIEALVAKEGMEEADAKEEDTASFIKEEQIGICPACQAISFSEVCPSCGVKLEQFEYPEPDAMTDRFSWKLIGRQKVPGSGEVVLIQIDDMIYAYKPTQRLFQGDSQALLSAIEKMVKDGGPGQAMAAINQWVKDGSLKIAYRGAEMPDTSCPPTPRNPASWGQGYVGRGNQ